MKALTLWQPWASLVAAGAKTIETRSWSTDYRGPLAIHSALAADNLSLALHGSMKAALTVAGINPEALPLGKIVAVCYLSACLSTDEELPDLPAWEFEFGDFSPGRYAWFLASIQALDFPIPVRGRQGLWNWANPPREMDVKPATWTAKPPLKGMP
jgi:hypothetical protein